MLVAGKSVCGLFAQVVVHASNDEVHGRQPPGGGVGLLAVNGHVAQLAAMGFDELFALHKHAAGAAAGVVHLAFGGGQHFDQRFDDGGWRVELPTPLAFGTGKHAEEVFVNLPEDVSGS